MRNRYGSAALQFFGRLENWLERRQQRAAEDGRPDRAGRYAELRYIANTKICHEGCRDLPVMIMPYSDFA
jgi:hypothetical protein